MRYESKLVAASSDCIFYQSIEDDPDERSLCELDCRDHLCTEREWIICRRLHDFASGRVYASWPDRRKVTAVGREVLKAQQENSRQSPTAL